MVRDDGGKYSLNGKPEFCILAGWTWKYEGDAMFNPPNTNGTSAALAAITIDATALKLVSDALANTEAFKGWTAAINRELREIPAPGGAALLALAGVAAWRRRRAG